MVKLLVVFVRSVARFNERLGQAMTWVIWGLLGILLFETVSRYGFNRPHSWSVEIDAYIFGTYFFLAGGFALLHNEHVRMDALYNHWSPRKQAIADAATFCLVAFYLVTLIWKGVFYAYLACVTGETTASAARTLVGPIKVIMVIGLVAIFLQALAFFIQDIYLATTGRALVR